jgi:integrase
VVWLDLNELKQDSIIIDWLDNINAAANTEKLYLQAMRQYTDFTGLTPEQLLTEAEGETKAGMLMRHRKIKSYIIGFRKHLQETGVADGSIKTRLTGVRSFYQSFDIELPKVQGERRKAHRIEENQVVPTKEDLQECLKVCDPLEKAVMLTGISSGLAANEIRHLRIKDFKKGYDPETEICTFKLNREKVNFDFVTFTSPEASRAISEYLEFRNREVKTGNQKRISQLEKQRVTSDNGYLFVLQNISDEYLKTKNEELRYIPEQGMIRLYRSISEKAKKNTGKGYFNFIRSHTMRKYFNSALLNAGCDSFHCEFWMGHTLDETRAAYFRANPIALREIYEKYVPYLTIQKELNVSESPEFQKLKSENEVLARETAKATVERAEIQRLKAEFDVRMLEVERDAYIRPYKVEIDDLKYNVEESKKILKTLTTEQLKTETDKMLHWNGKIKYLEEQISQLRFEYKIKIDELKS